MTNSQKFFLRTAGSFSLFMLGFELLDDLWLDPRPIEWVPTLLGPLVAGVLFGFWMTHFQKGLMKEKGLDPNRAEDWQPHQADEILIRCEIDEVWETLTTALSTRERWRLRERAPGTGKLAFRRRMNMWSWGEEVTVTLRDMNDGFTLVQMESRPLYPLTFADYGIGAENLATIRNLVSALEQKGSAGQREYDGLPEPEQ
jgi:hypothetical protein